MSTQAHTPGPWHVAQINATDKPWAVIGQGPHGDEIVAGYLRNESDARLIASALAMLAALTECRRQLFRVCEERDLMGDPQAEAISAADAAIAKAEGRS